MYFYAVMDFIDRILQADRTIFLTINKEWANPFFDIIMPFAREMNIWIPLYLFLILLVATNFGKRGALWILFFIIVAALSDILSSHIIKENIFRLRPCRDAALSQYVRVVVAYCPGSSSFTSSHAFNHFALATFFYNTLKFYFPRKWLALFFLWAAVIVYAQVYVGVHYPFDVLAGTAMGCITGGAISAIFNKKIGLEAIKTSKA